MGTKQGIYIIPYIALDYSAVFSFINYSDLWPLLADGKSELTTSQNGNIGLDISNLFFTYLTKTHSSKDIVLLTGRNGTTKRY